MKISNSRQRGFTWIEMVMIIVILGILAAVAVPRFVNFQAKTGQSSVIDAPCHCECHSA